MAFKIVWSELACRICATLSNSLRGQSSGWRRRSVFLLISKWIRFHAFLAWGECSGNRRRRLSEIVFRSYRIIYHLEDAQHAIAIIRIWHGARGEPEIL